MKIFEFASSNQPKISPYADNMDVLIKKAQEGVDSENVKVVQIPVSKLLLTQPFDEDLDRSEHDYNEYDSLPFAVLLDGYYHLLDGHKRVSAGIDEGNTRVLVLVTDADASELDEAKHKHKKHHQSTTTPVIPFYNRWWYGGYYGHNDIDHDNDGDHDADDQGTDTDDSGTASDAGAGDSSGAAAS